MNIDKYGITTVDIKLIRYREEPFVLAKNVTQIFYVKDMDLANKEERHMVLQGKRRIIGVENAVDEEDYNQFDALPPFRGRQPRSQTPTNLPMYVVIIMKGESLRQSS